MGVLNYAVDKIARQNSLAGGGGQGKVHPVKEVPEGYSFFKDEDMNIEVITEKPTDDESNSDGHIDISTNDTGAQDTYLKTPASAFADVAHSPSLVKRLLPNLMEVASVNSLTSTGSNENRLSAVPHFRSDELHKNSTTSASPNFARKIPPIPSAGGNIPRSQMPVPSSRLAYSDQDNQPTAPDSRSYSLATGSSTTLSKESKPSQTQLQQQAQQSRKSSTTTTGHGHIPFSSLPQTVAGSSEAIRIPSFHRNSFKDETPLLPTGPTFIDVLDKEALNAKLTQVRQEAQNLVDVDDEEASALEDSNEKLISAHSSQNNLNNPSNMSRKERQSSFVALEDPDIESERVAKYLLSTLAAKGIQTGGSSRKWDGVKRQDPSSDLVGGNSAKQLPGIASGKVEPEEVASGATAIAAATPHSAVATQKAVEDPGHLGVIYESLTPGLEFTSKALEARFRRESNIQTWPNFLRQLIKGLICELLLVVLGIVNVYFVQGANLVAESGSAYLVVAMGSVGIGTQLILMGINFFEETAGNGAMGSPTSVRMVNIALSTTGMFITALLVCLPWSHLNEYFLLTSMVIPQFVALYALLWDGVPFMTRVTVSVGVSLCFVIVTAALRQLFWYVSLGLVASAAICVVIFSIRETSLRLEYLMDLILGTQADLVREEMIKSSNVLRTVLPARIINKLISEPATTFYEEFPDVTVLHMDIAGFTAMSSNMEPINIIRMLNTLFIYFDRLTEDLNVEKITTIGDAYVASSSLSNLSDPKISAISVCIVAIQMQAFVIEQLNRSALMTKRLKQQLFMRIGVHSGPAYGAVMGGAKNFRYDLMGDTGI
jgi:class 3 adenylate cyclase